MWIAFAFSAAPSIAGHGVENILQLGFVFKMCRIPAGAILSQVRPVRYFAGMSYLMHGRMAVVQLKRNSVCSSMHELRRCGAASDVCHHPAISSRVSAMRPQPAFSRLAGNGEAPKNFNKFRMQHAVILLAKAARG